MSRGKKRNWWIGAGIVVAVLAGGGVIAARGLGGGDEPPVAGRVVKVVTGPLVDVASASGTIEPETLVEVKSRAGGEVTEILVQQGDQVKQGQLLVQLDPIDAERALKDARNALSRVQADVAGASAALQAAKLDVEKKKQDEGIATKGSGLGLTTEQATRDAVFATRTAEVTVAQRSAALASSAAQLEAARIAVEDAERNVAYTKIVAPIDGTVLSIAVEKGTIVSSALTNVSGGTAVVTLANLEDLRVVGSVDEAQIARVAVGQDVTVRVDAFPERSFTGTVELLASQGVAVSNVVTFEVEVVVTDPDAHLLRPGMSADLEIVAARTENATLVPLTAIQTEGGKRFVTLKTGERRAIRTGATDGTNIAVLEGVAPGDELVLAAVRPPTEGPPRPGGGMMGGPRMRR